MGNDAAQVVVAPGYRQNRNVADLSATARMWAPPSFREHVTVSRAWGGWGLGSCEGPGAPALEGTLLPLPTPRQPPTTPAAIKKQSCAYKVIQVRLNTNLFPSFQIIVF